MEAPLADREFYNGDMCKLGISNQHLCLAIWSNPGSSNIETAKPDPLTPAHMGLPFLDNCDIAPAWRTIHPSFTEFKENNNEPELCS